MNPYLVLRVPRDADDKQIRSAYLTAVKESTPESDPERFKAISAAYEQIKDEESRLRFELEGGPAPGNTPVDTLLQYIRVAPRPGPLSFESMKEWLRLCLKS